jgi:hypothetical protein
MLFDAHPKPAIIVPAPRELVRPKRSLILPSKKHGLVKALIPGLAPFFGAAGAAAAPVQLTHEASNQSTSNLTTYTFNTQAIGTADDDRWVMVAIGGIDSANTFNVASASFGGIAAALVTGCSIAGTTPNDQVELWAANVPTGTTGNISVTWSEAIISCFIDVFRLVTTTDPTTPFDAQTDNGDFDPSWTLDIPAGGGVIGAFIHNAGATTDDADMTWSGLTEASDAWDATDWANWTAAFAEFADAETAFAISGANSIYSGASTSTCGFVASFSP